jgi:hypothetical protein
LPPQTPQVLANKDAYNICAINLSLGDGRKMTEPCPGSVYEAPFAAARAAGVVPVVASGNDYYQNALSDPACAPSAVSVGAVHDSDHGRFDNCDATTAADKFACFSNVAPYLDLLAPGSTITAGGVTMSGTSMAAPHVAAAAAVLRGMSPAASAAKIVSAMKATGRMLQSPYSSDRFPRIDLGAAVALLKSGGGADAAAPLAYVKINGGAATTSTPRVTLSITAKDDSGTGGMTMCVSNSATCGGAFVPFATSLPWLLPPATATQAVYVWLRDAAGNAMGAPASARIDLSLAGDLSVPTDPPSLQLNRTSPTSIEVKWDPATATDADTGVAGFKLVYRLATQPPVRCTTARAGVQVAALPLNDPNTGRFLVEGLRTRRRYRFRLCAVDYAGNVGNGVTGSAYTKPRARAASRTN